jgi:hypothetical protein
MVFSSPLFILLFLPLTLAAYYALPRGWRNGVLLVASLAFYAWGELRYVPLVLGSVLFNGWAGMRIGDAADPRARRRWLALAVTVNLATLAVFKYANFAFENWAAVGPWLGVAPAAVAIATIPLPLGISFFTFHAISYVVDVYKRNAAPQRNVPTFALYILLFPQLIAGPIIRWRDIATQLSGRRERLADVAYGVRRFIIGLAKKVLIANTLGRVADPLFALPGSELTTPIAWLGLACYTLQIYFDFSGYSDMAIGLMRMFGFRILENFNYPTWPAASASSGAAGTSRCRTGSAITSTFPSGATGAGGGANTRTSSSCSCCAACGTARAGRSCCGVRGTAYSSCSSAPASGVRSQGRRGSRTCTRWAWSWSAGCCSAATRSRTRRGTTARSRASRRGMRRAPRSPNGSIR